MWDGNKGICMENRIDSKRVSSGEELYILFDLDIAVFTVASLQLHLT